MDAFETTPSPTLALESLHGEGAASLQAEELVCDGCGLKSDADSMEGQEYVRLQFTGGFGSTFGDGEAHRTLLCQHCVRLRLGDVLSRVDASTGQKLPPAPPPSPGALCTLLTVDLDALDDPNLTGEHGTNRAPVSELQIEAKTDREAIKAFLAEYDKSPGTERLYSRECTRLQLWAVRERNKPVSSLNRQDFEAYLNFLADPQPASMWCGPRAKIGSPEWRPFTGPLGDTAVMTSMAAISSMVKYLVQAGYLAGNPIGLIRQKRHKMLAKAAEGQGHNGMAVTKTDEANTIERFLDSEMWQAVNAAVEAMPRESELERLEYERTRFLCAMLYLMAPRPGELEEHTMASFHEVRGRWWWRVVGKGRKLAQLPVPDDMLQALIRYRTHLGLTPVPGREDTTPLLVSTRGRQLRGITTRRLNQILKTLFHRAGTFLPPNAAYKALTLNKASAHWCRHTSITAKVDAGLSLKHVQESARHGDLRTTQGYMHAEGEAWHDDAQLHRLPWKEKEVG